MSKILSIALCGLFLGSACQEERQVKVSPEVPDALEFESTSVLHLNPSLTTGVIDWNFNVALLKSEEVLEEAAEAAETDVATFEKATSTFIDVDQGEIRVVAVHADRDKAKQFADVLAAEFLAARKVAEVLAAEARLDELNLELKAQKLAIEAGRANLEALLGGCGIRNSESIDDGSEDRDRMTYEKAREALAEEEGKKGDSGVLFQKQPSE